MATASSNIPVKRLYVLAALLSFWVMGICARLVQLQVARYGDFQQQASRQRQQTIKADPPRGVIFDRSGHELAMSVQVDSAFAVPAEIPDPENTANLLGRVLQSDAGEILARLKSSR